MPTVLITIPANDFVTRNPTPPRDHPPTGLGESPHGLLNPRAWERRRPY